MRSFLESDIVLKIDSFLHAEFRQLQFVSSAFNSAFNSAFR